MSALVRYDEARRQLAAVARVDEAKDICDKAAALEAYARQKNDVEMEAWVSEIKLRAIVRIGEISAQLDKGHKVGQGSEVQLPTGGKLKAEVLKAAGISTSAAHRAETLAKHAVAVEAYISKKVAQRKPVKYTEVLHAIECQEREDSHKAELHRPVAGNFTRGQVICADQTVTVDYQNDKWCVRVGANATGQKFDPIAWNKLIEEAKTLPQVAEQVAAEKKADGTIKKLQREFDRAMKSARQESSTASRALREACYQHLEELHGTPKWQHWSYLKIPAEISAALLAMPRDEFDRWTSAFVDPEMWNLLIDDLLERGAISLGPDWPPDEPVVTGRIINGDMRDLGTSRDPLAGHSQATGWTGFGNEAAA